MHDICTEFHKNRSGFAYCTDVNNHLVGWTLLKRLGTRTLQIIFVMPVFHLQERIKNANKKYLMPQKIFRNKNIFKKLKLTIRLHVTTVVASPRNGRNSNDNIR